jgi:hypothetical protein
MTPTTNVTSTNAMMKETSIVANNSPAEMAMV